MQGPVSSHSSLSSPPPPPPDPGQLLPPLLACLPASFLSPRPPPALLPLLSPVLRQRLNYLSHTGQGHQQAGWLPLLSWDAQTSVHLPGAVERIQIEPHPVSGEIELEHVAPAKYRRLDRETLHAILQVQQFGLAPIYLWCESDEHGGTGPGWKLADLRILQDSSDLSDWIDSPDLARETLSRPNGNPVDEIAQGLIQQPDPDDDDDYWAAYDREPAQTPAQEQSTARPSTLSTSQRDRSQSELEYFSRYGSVQPVMDAHDPEEDVVDPSSHQSSLSGGTLLSRGSRFAPQVTSNTDNHDRPSTILSPNTRNVNNSSNGRLGPADIPSPRLASADSPNGSVEGRLEDEAVTAMDDRAQIGIKQHISTDIKSLYRLAKSAGFSRDEFCDLITRELEVLSIFDQDD